MLPFGSFSYTSSTQIPALLVILVFLVFPRAPLFLVCCLGRIPHVSQPVAGWLHLWTGGKQAQDPPGSLHTIVSPVEWSSLKGRSPRWFTVRKTTCFTKMPLVTISGHVITAFYSLYFLALLYCIFLYIFFLLWLFLWFFKFFYQVLFHGCSFFKGTFLPWVLLFLAVSLPLFLPSSSWWWFFGTP